MTIIESLIQLRDDLKTWVTNNLNALNVKIDEKTISIDDSLNNTSTNPVQNKVITEAINNIDYDNLNNKPNILDDGSDSFIISDKAGNIILNVDAEGLKTTAILINGEDVVQKIEEHADDNQIHVTTEEKNVWNNKSDFNGDYNDLINKPNILDDQSDSFIIADDKGNIILNVDASGVKTTAVSINGEDVIEKIDSVNNAFNTHAADNIVHITESERANWNNKDYNDLINKPNILDDQSDSFKITDDKDNIILTVDKNGLNTTALLLNGVDIQTDLAKKSNVGHNHDDSYYTESEIDTKLTPVTTHINNSDIHVTADDKAKLSNIENIIEDESGALYIVDDKDNIVATIDESGLNTIDVAIKGVSVQNIIDQKAKQLKDDLLNGAGEAYDTLKELGELIDDNADAIEALNNIAASKADRSTLEEHANNTDIHTTSDERNALNSVISNFNNHASNENIHVTTEDKEKWNDKNYSSLTGAPNITEDESGALHIADDKGNIAMSVDSSGVNVSNLLVKGINLQSMLDGKVDKDGEKGLSSNDFTDEEKEKLAKLEPDFIINVNTDGTVDKTTIELIDVFTNSCLRQLSVVSEGGFQLTAAREYKYAGMRAGDGHEVALYHEFYCLEGGACYTAILNIYIDANRAPKVIFEKEEVNYYITPQMFGAKADGKTDDTEAFLATAEACKNSKKTFYVPEGTYFIKENCILDCVPNIEIDGYIKCGDTGSLTLRDNAYVGLSRRVRVARCDNLIIRDFINSYFEFGRISKLTIYANINDLPEGRTRSAFGYNYLVNGRVTELELTAVDEAWINENTFERIRIDKLTINKANNNKFHDVNLESGNVIINRGHNNYISYRGEGGCNIELSEGFDYTTQNPDAFNNIFEKHYMSVQERFMNELKVHTAKYGNVIMHGDALRRIERSVKRYDINNMPSHTKTDNGLVITKPGIDYGEGVVLELKDDTIIRAVGDKIRLTMRLLDANFEPITIESPPADYDYNQSEEDDLYKQLRRTVNTNDMSISNGNCYKSEPHDDIVVSIHKDDKIFKYVKLNISNREAVTTPGAEIFTLSMQPPRVIDIEEFLNKEYVTPEMFGAIGDGVNDDTEAFQTALTTGRKVVASKNYLVDSISIQNNDLELSGTITGQIKLHNNASVIGGTIKSISDDVPCVIIESNVSNVGQLNSILEKCDLKPSANGIGIKIVADTNPLFNFTVRDINITSCDTSIKFYCTRWITKSTFSNIYCHSPRVCIDFQSADYNRDAGSAGIGDITFTTVFGQYNSSKKWPQNFVYVCNDEGWNGWVKANFDNCIVYDGIGEHFFGGLDDTKTMIDTKFTLSGRLDWNPYASNFSSDGHLMHFLINGQYNGYPWPLVHTIKANSTPAKVDYAASAMVTYPLDSKLGSRFLGVHSRVGTIGNAAEQKRLSGLSWYNGRIIGLKGEIKDNVADVDNALLYEAQTSYSGYTVSMQEGDKLPSNVLDGATVFRTDINQHVTYAGNKWWMSDGREIKDKDNPPIQSTAALIENNTNLITNLTNRLDGIVAQGGEPNTINTIKVNGVALTITNEKAVDISADPEGSATQALAAAKQHTEQLIEWGSF